MKFQFEYLLQLKNFSRFHKIFSLDDFLAAPSAKLLHTETAALLNCDTKTNCSSLGKNFVSLYISFTISNEILYTSSFL